MSNPIDDDFWDFLVELRMLPIESSIDISAVDFLFPKGFLFSGSLSVGVYF